MSSRAEYMDVREARHSTVLHAKAEGRPIGYNPTMLYPVSTKCTSPVTPLARSDRK